MSGSDLDRLLLAPQPVVYDVVHIDSPAIIHPDEASAIASELWAGHVERLAGVAVGESAHVTPQDVMGETHTSFGSSSKGATSAAVEDATILSAPDAHCYLSGTVFVLDSDVQVAVAELEVGSMVRSPKIRGHPVCVNSITRHEEQRQDLVALVTSFAEITVTASHRIMVERGGAMQPDQASHLSIGDRVVLSDGNTEALTSVRQFSMPMEVWEVKFAPDAPVAAFHTTPSTILSIGTGYKRTRRGQAGDRMRQQLLLRGAAMERGAQAAAEGGPGSSKNV